MLALLGAGILSGGNAHGKEGDVTSRDVEKAFRTIRRAIGGGAEALPFDKPQVLKVVTDEGGTNLKTLRDDLTSYVFEERTNVVVFYDDGDIQLRHHLSGGTWDTAAANEWNRTRRVGKAYLLEDGSIVLEYTLLASQGPSEVWLRGALGAFHEALRGYATFVREKNQDGDK